MIYAMMCKFCDTGVRYHVILLATLFCPEFWPYHYFLVVSGSN